MLPFFFFFQCCCCLVAKSSLIRQAPLSMGFLRQEYWSGLPFPSPMLPFFFFMLPFLIHLFVSPEINKSHSNDSLDFPMHLPHTPWDLIEAYWYFSSQSCQLIFNYFFLPELPQGLCPLAQPGLTVSCHAGALTCPFLVPHVTESHSLDSTSSSFFIYPY